MSNRKSMHDVESERKRLLREWGPRRFTNMLDEMMSMQRRFGKKFCDFDNLTIKQRETWTKEFVVCCMDELSEILNWTNFKHWKKPTYPVDETEIRYEIIDLLHFVLSLMLVWKMTPEDVFSIYVAKNRENQNRQENDY